MERSGWDYLGSVSPDAAAYRTLLPKLSSDDAPLTGSSFLLGSTSATTETVTWDGVAAPVTLAIPPVR